MNARRTDLNTAEELRSILAEELEGGEGAAMTDLLVRHRDHMDEAARHATRNLSVRVAATAQPRVAPQRGWMLALGSVTAVATVVAIVRLTQPATPDVLVAPVKAPVAAAVISTPTRPTPEVAPIRVAEPQRSRAVRPEAPAAADLDAMADDALVATLSSGLSPRDAWTVSEADVDILLEESSDGL